ncbi:hypothetical protein [Larkinella terrae]|uniref:DUF4175 family protein n=1 Tax=Larkinella terrae TaxID=2025311 RepID=A0A7K0EV29_9BACT|nr:hypothetical protein [Larkinella terrae]MRS65675.1 hypothetical protein [Larkinella terrae]
MNELKRTLAALVYQLIANALLRSFLLGIATGFGARIVGFSPSIALVMGVLGFGLGAWITQLFRSKKTQAIAIIHQTIGDAEYSLPLLDKEELNVAERLQLERLNDRIQTIRMPVRQVFSVLFSKTGLYVLLVFISGAIYYGYPVFKSTDSVQKRLSEYIPASQKENHPLIPAFQTALVQIQPPGYTGLPDKESSDLNITAISGSRLTWQLRFSKHENVSVRLVNSRNEELVFKRTESHFEYRDQLVSSGIYAIRAYWNSSSKKDSLIYQSDYFRLEAQPDLAPRIQPDSKELYRFYFLKDDKNLRISARISDDFKVRQSFIVATLARGSGENVKFREVKFPLPQSNFKDAHLTKMIDLKALDFAPGDELYYYWAAIDNKEPEPNFAKSDTYFVVYKDTAKVDEAELATMAVNIMPEYFRSQRQIIIDTEKLITKRKKLAASAFKSASNEIGFDQKALRLRYGQYLGEEFENSIGGHDLVAEGNVLEGFIHKHDTDEEKNAPKPFAFKAIEKAENEQKKELPAPDEHSHDHGKSETGSGKDDHVAALLEQYIHSHDDGEANTFYEQSTRSLLKMALEQMWQSELHLRLYEPEKALPFENKALIYLKAAQHKARTFVKKSGYDPPPIKEKETRLTGELNKVNTRYNQERMYSPLQLGRLAGEVLGYLDLNALTSRQRLTIQQLSSALTNPIINSSLSNWSVITVLQKMGDGKPLSGKEKAELKTKLYSLAGAASRNEKRSGIGTYSSERKLEQSFWRHLK